MNYATAIYGENARHVPCWMYVQDAGDGIVCLAGASRVVGAHPLRYGSERTHQLIVGEIIVRPHRVIATDVLRGYGVSALLTDAPDIAAMLANGEMLVGAP